MNEDIKKYKIDRNKYVQEDIVATSSVKKLIEELQGFLTKYNLAEARLEEDTCDDAAWFGFRLSGAIPKTKEELLAEIEQRKMWDQEKTQARKNRYQENKDREYQVYLALHKKYGKEKKV